MAENVKARKESTASGSKQNWDTGFVKFDKPMDTSMEKIDAVVLKVKLTEKDIKTEQSLYELLKQRDLSFISVGHRPSLIDFHTSVLELKGEGSWRLLPKNDYKFNET